MHDFVFLKISQYKDPVDKVCSKSFKTSCSPQAVNLYIDGTKKPGPGPPWHILTAIRWPILFAVLSATLSIPHIGSKPSDSSPPKENLDKKTKQYRFSDFFLKNNITDNTVPIS